jgi:hypothetical protein
MTGSGPSISVVVVCDYDAGRHGGWADIRKTLTALAVQDIEEPAEFILCQSEEFREEMPDDFTRILPDLKIVFAPCQSAYELKKVGVKAASSELVAMLDADCLPRRDWLRRLLDALRRHPEAAAVSGRTFYGGKSLWARTFALFSRAYVNPGGDGPTRFVCDNNAGYRRSAYLAHPIPTDMGNFAAHLQSSGLLRQGYVFGAIAVTVWSGHGCLTGRFPMPGWCASVRQESHPFSPERFSAVGRRSEEGNSVRPVSGEVAGSIFDFRFRFPLQPAGRQPCLEEKSRDGEDLGERQ